MLSVPSSSFSVTKSVVIKGAILDSQLIYQPIQDEFQTRFGFIAIGNISFRCQDRINVAASITCNFVTSNRYNESQKRIESYEVPLTVFNLKQAEISVTRVTPIWFPLNTMCEKMEFRVNNIETDSRLNLQVMLS